MRPLIVAVVARSCNTRFHIVAGTVESGGREVDWEVCTEIALSAIPSGDPLVGIDQCFVELLSEATHILVCQRGIRNLLLHTFDRVLDDQVKLMDTPIQRECMLWPSFTSRRWEPLLSQHWKAVDLVYTHIRRAHQTAVANGMRQKQMTNKDFFQQYAYQPLHKATP